MSVSVLSVTVKRNRLPHTSMSAPVKPQDNKHPNATPTSHKVTSSQIPVLRANPYTKGPNPLCRLPLPTLFITRGFSPWEPDAVIGTPSIDNMLSDFQGVPRMHGRLQMLPFSAKTRTVSWSNTFPRIFLCQEEKKTLIQQRETVSNIQSVTIYCLNRDLRILTQFPFAVRQSH